MVRIWVSSPDIQIIGRFRGSFGAKKAWTVLPTLLLSHITTRLPKSLLWMRGCELCSPIPELTIDASLYSVEFPSESTPFPSSAHASGTPRSLEYRKIITIIIPIVTLLLFAFYSL